MHRKKSRRPMLSLTEAERYAMFADAASFKVMGLSSLIASAQDFQKLMAFFQWLVKTRC